MTAGSNKETRALGTHRKLIRFFRREVFAFFEAPQFVRQAFALFVVVDDMGERTS